MMSGLHVQAQKISTLMSNAKSATRTDVKISLGNNENEYLPISILKGKGKEKGKVFTIIAGVHGYEYPPIVAVQNLIKEIDPEKLNGTIIIVPIANTASFYGRSPFVNPLDGKNLNTAFPGNANGSITEKIADYITREIIPVSDVFLDIHGGDANEDLLPFICYYNNQNDKNNTENARKLSEASGMKHIVSYPYTITKTEPAKYAFKQAVQDGKTALSIEAGKLGTVQSENVELIKNAVFSMLNDAGYYHFNTMAADANKVYFDNQAYLKVPEKGLFYSSLKSGDQVKKDQILGQITNEFGIPTTEIKSTVNGTILYKIGTPPVNKGETLFCIGFSDGE